MKDPTRKWHLTKTVVEVEHWHYFAHDQDTLILNLLKVPAVKSVNVISNATVEVDDPNEGRKS